MTKQDLLKYAGKKTFGKNNALLTNGVIVGFDPNDNYEYLVARFENGDVQNCGWISTPRNIEFFTEEELQIYNSGKGCYLFAKIDNVIMDEQKELDLTKILRGCEGVELWSDICGKCVFIKIDDEDEVKHQICVEATEDDGMIVHECFSNDGRYNSYYPGGKCLLWPSETNRDWSTFKKPVKVRDDDWVACCESIEGGFVVCRYGKLITDWKYIIPYDEFRLDLTEEELKKLSIV